MSGSSAGNFVADAPAASDEDRALDEAARQIVGRIQFILSMLALASPEQKAVLDRVGADLTLFANREKAWRIEARLRNNDAIRQRVATSAYQSRADRLEDELDSANRKIKRLESQVTRLRAKAK